MNCKCSVTNLQSKINIQDSRYTFRNLDRLNNILTVKDVSPFQYLSARAYKAEFLIPLFSPSLHPRPNSALYSDQFSRSWVRLRRNPNCYIVKRWVTSIASRHYPPCLVKGSLPRSSRKYHILLLIGDDREPHA